MNDPKLKDSINLSNLKMFPHLFRKILPHLLNNTSMSHLMRRIEHVCMQTIYMELQQQSNAQNSLIN